MERGPVVESRVRVRYAETDAQRVVYHANYVVWFEVGRTDYCETAGYPYARMEAEGVFIAVTEVHARFRKPARYGDVVTVRTRFGGMKSRGCTFLYEVVLPDGSLAVEGETQHVFMDGEGRPRRVPPGVADAFRAFAGR
ncbi:MAG TPA: thioesterase family protein [Thermoanaerobaculia bacterium]|nr:thioesterase family protein [Thermoanaerobaculia bacterium]